MLPEVELLGHRYTTVERLYGGTGAIWTTVRIEGVVYHLLGYKIWHHLARAPGPWFQSDPLDLKAVGFVQFGTCEGSKAAIVHPDRNPEWELPPEWKYLGIHPNCHYPQEFLLYEKERLDRIQPWIPEVPLERPPSGHVV